MSDDKYVLCSDLRNPTGARSDDYSEDAPIRHGHVRTARSTPSLPSRNPSDHIRSPDSTIHSEMHQAFLSHSSDKQVLLLWTIWKIPSCHKGGIRSDHTGSPFHPTFGYGIPSDPKTPCTAYEHPIFPLFFQMHNKGVHCDYSRNVSGTHTSGSY